MSLDVYLIAETPVSRAGSGIFVRENGSTKEITSEEWNRRNPDREPVVVNREEMTDRVFHANITHNLGKMANEAGIYQALWKPEEIGITHASQLIEPLKIGLSQLERFPDHFKQFNPENGWGDYEGLADFVCEYLEACLKYPEARIEVSR